MTGCNVYVVNDATVEPNPISPSQGLPSAGQAGNVTVSPQYVAMGLAQKQHFLASAPGQEALQWYVNGVAGGNAQIGMVDSSGNYTSPASLQLGENITITVGGGYTHRFGGMSGDSKMKLFAEVRYLDVMTPAVVTQPNGLGTTTVPAGTKLIPITLGVRW